MIFFDVDVGGNFAVATCTTCGNIEVRQDIYNDTNVCAECGK